MDNTAIPEITRVRIDDVIVGDRIRREFKEEELASLTESIKTDGLLQPIVINQDNKLIAGHRRYTCCREIGYETIDARRVSTKGDLHEALLEIRENVIREDFTFSEKMRAAEAIEPIIAEKAEERKSNKEASDLSEFGIDLGKGKTRDIVAEILKIGSGKTYDNAKKVWASKNEDLIQRLDKKKTTINTAYSKIKTSKKPSKTEPALSSQAVETPADNQKQSISLTEMLEALNSLHELIDGGSYDENELQAVYEKMEVLMVEMKELLDHCY